MTRSKPKRFTAFLWHRRIGLLALVLVIVLAITGILLNHTEQLALDENYVQSSLVLDWYGLEPDGEPVSYPVDQHIITQWQHQLFFDNSVITTNAQSLRGAIRAEQFIVIAFDSEILLLSKQGELVERIPTGTSFSNTRRLGMKYLRPVIETAEPMYYMADEHIIDWDIISNEDISWSEPAIIDQAQRDALLQAFRGKGLSMERVMLDVHSGRIFGSFGVYVMDAAAIALLWLSFSGLWVWWRRRQKQKTKRHYRKHHRG